MADFDPIRSDADFLDREREGRLADEVGDALAVFVLDPELRGYLSEKHPRLLDQARDALGLRAFSRLPQLSDEQKQALADVRAVYGDDPQDVGVADGTEDDFGDLIHDTMVALGLNDEAIPDADRATAAASYCDSEELEEWARVILGAYLDVIPPVPSQEEPGPIERGDPRSEFSV